MIKLYNSADMCMDKELTFLSFEQKINAEFTVDEIISGDLWKVYANGGVYKCIPLFNCDLISSSNSKDIVLENNKGIILVGDDNTVVSVSSDDTGSIHYHSLQLYAFTPYSKLDVIDDIVVSVIVYDEFLNTLNNITVNVLVDGDIVGQIQTSNNGIAKYSVSEHCTVSFEYSENLSNTIMISGGD